MLINPLKINKKSFFRYRLIFLTSLDFIISFFVFNIIIFSLLNLQPLNIGKVIFFGFGVAFLTSVIAYLLGKNKTLLRQENPNFILQSIIVSFFSSLVFLVALPVFRDFNLQYLTYTFFLFFSFTNIGNTV